VYSIISHCVAGMLLTGMLDDGTIGLKAIFAKDLL
jgi:chemotaxis response regulator CheB